MGTYDVLPREVLDLEVRARPLQPPKSRELVLRYRERMWAIDGKEASK